MNKKFKTFSLVLIFVIVLVIVITCKFNETFLVDLNDTLGNRSINYSKVFPYNSEIKGAPEISGVPGTEKLINLLSSLSGTTISSVPIVTNNVLLNTIPGTFTVSDKNTLADANLIEVWYILNTFVDYLVSNKESRSFLIYEIDTVDLNVNIDINSGTISKNYSITFYIYNKKLNYTIQVQSNFTLNQNIYTYGTLVVNNISFPGTSNEVPGTSLIPGINYNTDRFATFQPIKILS